VLTNGITLPPGWIDQHTYRCFGEPYYTLERGSELFRLPVSTLQRWADNALRKKPNRHLGRVLKVRIAENYLLRRRRRKLVIRKADLEELSAKCSPEARGRAATERKRMKSQALDWLRNLLSHCGPMPGRIIRGLAEKAGIKASLLWWAKKTLHVQSEKSTTDGESYWLFPDQDLSQAPKNLADALVRLSTAERPDPAVEHASNSEASRTAEATVTPIAEQPATNERGAPEGEPFVPSPLQRAILDALDGKSLTADELQSTLRVDRSRLYYAGRRGGKGGLMELVAHGLILSGRGRGIRGYFRPDKPPVS
jgi:hypothetical protein